MKIVIEIDEDYYNAIKAIPNESSTLDMLLIKNGTPLPEHHGRLIDADKLQRVDHIVLESTIDNAPTIIEGSESK